MQPWTTASPDEQSGLPLRPNSPFFWMHHERGWEVYQDDEGAEILPVFSQLAEIPGVQGVRDTPRGPDSSHARVAMQDNGYTIIGRDRGYITRYKTKSGGWYYESIFATPKILGNRVIWKTDFKNYNNFRRSLIEDGVISPPDPDVLEMMVDELEVRISRHTTDQHIPAMVKKRQAIEDKLQALKNCIAEIKNPKKKRKK